MNRIEKRFKELRKNGHKAFIAFITAGYPSLSDTESLVREFDRIGVDIVELGVPFTDPMADGPVIQDASVAALKKNICLRDVLSMVKRLRTGVPVPICLMTYYNPVFCFGDKEFVDEAVAAGVDGVIIPDLPPEEDMPLVRYAAKKGLDVICFVSPTSTIKRIKYVARVSRGFIYYVSLTGTTGARKALPAELAIQLKKVKKYAKFAPVCAGFGFSTNSQVKEALRFADGVIVGSAIVKKIKESRGRRDWLARVSRFVKELKNV